MEVVIMGTAKEIADLLREIESRSEEEKERSDTNQDGPAEKQTLADNICESMRRDFRNWLNPKRKTIVIPFLDFT